MEFLEVPRKRTEQLQQMMEDATRHFLLSQYSQSLMVLQDVRKREGTKRSILLQNVVDNNTLLCRKQIEETLTEEHQQQFKTFEEMLQSLKGVCHSRRTKLVESVIEYNHLITLLQQSSGDQIEVKAELIEHTVREYLQKVEQSLVTSDLPVLLLKCLLSVCQILAGKVVSDWSIPAEKTKNPMNIWQAVMQIPSGSKKLRLSNTESDDELSLTDIHDVIKCLEACQKGAWLQALKLIKHRRKTWQGLLADEMEYVKAYCLYQLSLSEKVKKCLQKLLLRSDLSSSLKVRGHQLLGCCLAEQGKYNLAVQEFRAALGLGFRESLPFCIYNLSLIYRKMDATDAELGVFNLVTTVSVEDQKRCDGGRLAFTPEIAPELQTSSSELQAMSLYHLAHRCFELKRYEDASEKYLDLISLLEELPVVRLGNNSLLPVQPKSFMEIYLEAAISLLHMNKFEDAEIMCDIIISRSRGYKVKGQHQSGSLSQGTKNIPSQSLVDSHVIDSLENEGPSTSYKQRDDKTSLASQRKCYLESYHDDSEICLTLASAYLVKAECLLKMKNIDSSLESIDEALSVLHEYSADYTEDDTNSRSEPLAKRRKMESGETEKKQCGPGQHKVRQLKARSYNNKAVILIGQNKLTDALPVLLSSLECLPDNTDARINHCLLLFKLGHKKEAYTEWRSLQQNSL